MLFLANSLAPGRPPCPRRTKRIGALTLALVVSATLGCATAPDAPRSDGQVPQVPSSAAVFSAHGERYVENLFLFLCAPEHVPYPVGQGPSGPQRSQAEWQDREEELSACSERVAQRFTTLDAVRSLTWNGTGYSMSEAEMRGIARHGAAHLDEVATDLLRLEREKSQLSGALAGPTAPSLGTSLGPPL